MKRILLVVVVFGLLMAGVAFAFTRGSDAAQPGAGSLTITGQTWKWVKTQMNDNTLITPKDSNAFTITFGADGRVTGTTDCNNFMGNYKLDGNKLTFDAMASTKMFCQGSQEDEFHKYLAEVDGFLIDATQKQLILQIKLDSGTMVFEPGTAVEK